MTKSTSDSGTNNNQQIHQLLTSASPQTSLNLSNFSSLLILPNIAFTSSFLDSSNLQSVVSLMSISDSYNLVSSVLSSAVHSLYGTISVPSTSISLNFLFFSFILPWSSVLHMPAILFRALLNSSCPLTLATYLSFQ